VRALALMTFAGIARHPEQRAGAGHEDDGRWFEWRTLAPGPAG